MVQQCQMKLDEIEQQDMNESKRIQQVEQQCKKQLNIIQFQNRQQLSYQNFEKITFLSQLLNEFIICQIVGGISLQADFVATDKLKQSIELSKELIYYDQKEEKYYNRITTQYLEDSPLIPPSIRYALNNPFRRQTCLNVLGDLKNYLKSIQKIQQVNISNLNSADSLYQLEIIRKQIQQIQVNGYCNVDTKQIYDLLDQLLSQDSRINSVINMPQIHLLQQYLYQYYAFYSLLCKQFEQNYKFLTIGKINDINTQILKNKTQFANTGEFTLLIYNLSSQCFNIQACKRITNILLQNENQDIKNNFILIFDSILVQILENDVTLNNQQIEEDYYNTGIKIENIDEQFQYLTNIQNFLKYLIQQYQNMLNFIYNINQQLVSICSQSLFQKLIVHANKILISSCNEAKLIDNQRLVVNLVNQQFSKQIEQQCEQILIDFQQQKYKQQNLQYRMTKFGFYKNWDKYQVFLTDTETIDKLKENIQQDFLVQEQQPKISQQIHKLFSKKIKEIGKQYNQQDIIYENVQDLCKHAINEFNNNNITYKDFFQKDLQITRDKIYNYIINNYQDFHYVDQSMQKANIQIQQQLYQQYMQIKQITDNFIVDINNTQKGQTVQRQFYLTEANSKTQQFDIKFQDFNSCLEQYKQLAIKIQNIINQQENTTQENKKLLTQNQNTFKYKLILPNTICRNLIAPLPQIYQNDNILYKGTRIFNCKVIKQKLQQLFQDDFSMNNLIVPISLIEQQQAYYQTKQVWQKVQFTINFQIKKKINYQYKQNLNISKAVIQSFDQQRNAEQQILQQNNIKNIELQIKDFLSPEINELIKDQIYQVNGQTVSKVLLGDLKPIRQCIFLFIKRIDKLKQFYDYYKEQYNQLLDQIVQQVLHETNQRVKVAVDYMTLLTKQICNNYTQDFVYNQPEKQLPEIISFSSQTDLQQYNKNAKLFYQLADQLHLDKKHLNINKQTGQPIGLETQTEKLKSNIFCFDLNNLNSLITYKNMISKYSVQRQNGFKQCMIILDLYISQIQYSLQLIQNIEQFSQYFQYQQNLINQKKDLINQISKYTSQLIQLTIEVIVAGLKKLFSYQTYDIPKELLKDQKIVYEIKSLSDINKYPYSQFPYISNILKLIIEITQDTIHILQDNLPYETFIQVFSLLLQHFICIYVSQLTRYTIDQTGSKQQIIFIELQEIKKAWIQLFDELCNKQTVSIAFQNQIQNSLEIFDFLKIGFNWIPVQNIENQHVPKEIINLMMQMQLRSQNQQLQFLDGQDNKIGLLGKFDIIKLF